MKRFFPLLPAAFAVLCSGAAFASEETATPDMTMPIVLGCVVLLAVFAVIAYAIRSNRESAKQLEDLRREEAASRQNAENRRKAERMAAIRTATAAAELGERAQPETSATKVAYPPAVSPQPNPATPAPYRPTHTPTGKKKRRGGGRRGRRGGGYVGGSCGGASCSSSSGSSCGSSSGGSSCGSSS